MATLRLFFVKLLFSPLWLLDFLEISFFGFARYITYVLIVTVSVQLVIPGSFVNTKYNGLLKDLSYLNEGIVATLYPQNVEVSTQVLGAASKRQIPFISREINVPSITAKAALIFDLKYGKSLFNLNEHQRLAPASTTKLMTALVALDLYDLNDVVAVPAYCPSIDSTRAGFYENQSLTVRELLYSLLIASAGDSACTLATAKIGYNDFVTKMNDRANGIGMKDTNFSNPIGLDGAGGEHYSTAYDLHLLAKYAIRNPLIKEIVKTQEYTAGELAMQNTNKLLWEISGSVGIKTGRTAEAGEVLIYEYADKERDVMVIVMGSQNRFDDTKSLLSWVLSSYSWE